MASEKKTGVKVVIIGAGPTGLGAAWRLHELISAGLGGAGIDWVMLDRAPKAGGLAASVVDQNGFTWDMGGHVIFSHYEYFTQLLDNLLEDWNAHEREAWVWMRDRFIPYPFQNNIWRLPPDDLCKCLDGLLEVERTSGLHRGKPKNFQEWLERGFGKGLMDVFMTPYNTKVWAYPPADMNVEWMGERVATVDLAKVLHNIVYRKDDIGWGPNATFRFPTHGGTGAIWQALYENLPREKVLLNKHVTVVDAANRTVTCADGTVYAYDKLISTIPLDLLCKVIKGLGMPEEELKKYPQRFRYSSSHIVGIGIEGQPPEHLKTKCWLYFPEDDCPFYRATVFSNYSKYNVPKPGQQWSLMCEISESPKKPVDVAKIIEQTEKGLIATKLITPADKIATRFHIRLEHGYPTPFYGRDQVCAPLFDLLHKNNILSRGRFGAWKYEVSNQDHSLMQGVEAADHVIFGSMEPTFHHPSIVNDKLQKDRKLLLKPKPKSYAALFQQAQAQAAASSAAAAAASAAAPVAMSDVNEQKGK